MGERVRRGGIAVGVEDACDRMRKERIRQSNCWREWIKSGGAQRIRANAGHTICYKSNEPHVTG